MSREELGDGVDGEIGHITSDTERKAWPHDCPERREIIAVSDGDICRFCAQGPEDEDWSEHTGTGRSEDER